MVVKSEVVLFIESHEVTVALLQTSHLRLCLFQLLDIS